MSNIKHNNMACNEYEITPYLINRALRTALAVENPDDGVVAFKKSIVIPKGLTKTVAVNEEDESIAKFRADFINYFELTSTSLLDKPQYADKQLHITKIKASFPSIFVALDQTQSGSLNEPDCGSDTGEDLKTQKEVEDVNRFNLNQHLIDIYGPGSDIIISRIKESFGDQIIQSAYWNPYSGECPVHSLRLLNLNIQKYKNTLYYNIIQYMKQVFPDKYKAYPNTLFGETGFDFIQYNALLKDFYSYIKSLDDFQETIDNDNRAITNGDVKNGKTQQYQDMMKKLLKNPDFKTSFDNAFRSAVRIDKAKNVLFSGDSFSDHYFTVKKLIQKHKDKLKELYVGDKTIFEVIQDLESEPITLLSATNAYSTLTHFDELLKDVMGNTIMTDRNYKDRETDNLSKYNYHQDTDHEKKSWQLGESIDSEKYTSVFTKAVLHMIKIYDINTDNYTNQRVDSTSFIVAIRNLLDDFAYNRFDIEKIEVKGNKVWNRSEAREKLLIAIKEFHNSPSTNLATILKLLFGDVEENGMHNLWQDVMRKGTVRALTSQNDVNLLYSVYKVIFDPDNPNSLINIESSKKFRRITNMTSVIGEIAGYADRNSNIHYLDIEIDYSDGMPNLKVKRKYSNNLLFAKALKNINGITHQYSPERKENLDEAYKFKENAAIVHGNPSYSVTIGGREYTLVVNLDSGGIFNNKYLYWADKVDDMPIKLVCKSVDILLFRKKKLAPGSNFTEDELTLNVLLEFIDNYLHLGFSENPDYFLQQLAIYKNIYAPNESDLIYGNYYLEPLLKLAMRAAYANHQEVEAERQNLDLGAYLVNANDSLYADYQRNKTKNRNFSERWGDLRHVIATRFDGVLGLWADAAMILSGDSAKATTKDKQGNSLPNNSVNKLGNILPYYLAYQNGGRKITNTSSLLFAQYPNLIKSVYHEMECTNIEGDNKAVSSMSSGELIYNSFVNKFFGSYIQNSTLVILPTTYSDKTTFLNWGLSPKVIVDGKEQDLMTLDSDKELPQVVRKLYRDTIGQAYLNIWKNSQLKFKLILAYINRDGLKYSTIKDYLQSVTEKQLIADASGCDIWLNNNEDIKRGFGIEGKVHIELELDKDYRVIKIKDGQYCAVNEMLEYYATELYVNDSALETVLKQQQAITVKNMINSGVFFLVIDWNDNYDDWAAEDRSGTGTSNNALIGIITHLYDVVPQRKRFFRDWVDAKSGRLILAKQGENNIIDGTSTMTDGDVLLNPLLNKFFYIEGLFSNNLRMSLTGTECNHPDKAKVTTYTKLKAFKTYNLLLEKEGDSVKAQQAYDAQVVSLNKELRVKANGSDYEAALALIKGTNTISEISWNNIDTDMPNIILNLVYHTSMLTIINTAQGTQFKRNVIIPATLQYCRQGAFNGVTAKIKYAVIDDEKAPVWNYRGDREKDIDSADGSAQINPFQSILENMALDSLAVGFVKKPIWHSYDVNGGTAFLAKFATDTITNEAMRASVTAHTNLHNLFRKMTNMQWDPSVDLMQTIPFGKILDNISFSNYFLSHILNNPTINNEVSFENRLLYQGPFYDRSLNLGIIEITNFGKTSTANGLSIYYTEERDYDSLTENDSPTHPVWHVFYDAKENETVIKSKHITFNSWQSAADFMKNTEGAHTINSLYELHTALGGINCCDAKGKVSEFNNLVVVNFMNNTGSHIEGRPELLSLDNYVQPLKEFHIGYALNNTAVKNGAKNKNPKARWYDSEELTWAEADSAGLGMLMNADHDIVDSELTEFSQVIAATSAYGYTYDKCNEIFTGLAKTAFEASESLLRSVNKFLQEFEDASRDSARSDLYDAIGRIILVNQSIKNNESLQGIIMQAVLKVFNKNKNHNDDSLKIPFSDANLYSDFIATLASTVTSQSIKRKHPGSGCVMVPGYNIIQYYEINGNKYMTDDVLALARKNKEEQLRLAISDITTAKGLLVDGKITINEKSYSISGFNFSGLAKLALDLKIADKVGLGDFLDITAYNTKLIKEYLESVQAAEPSMENGEWFMPSDVVDILDPEGNKIETVQLNDLDTYYKFKDGVYQAQHAHKVKIDVKYTEGKYTIALEEAPDLMFIIEAEKDEDGNYTGKYNIHFRTGGYDETTGRRTVGDLTTEQKQRLFKATLQVLPMGAILRLSPTTKEQLDSGIGGLTSGSIAGYKSIIAEDSKRTEGTIMTAIGDPYVVDYFDALGEKFSTEVTEYKKIGQTQSYKFAKNVTVPRNLRPSLIRWKYIGEDGKEHYQNVFDSSVVRKAYTEGYNKDPQYRKKIQDLLHSIESGYDPDHNANIIEGSLENTAAELVMSDIYQAKFGTEGKTLQLVLEKGESFFRPRKINAPQYLGYDIAFVSDLGLHTLISLGGNPGPSAFKISFDSNLLVENDKGEIIYTKGGKELFEVGRWAIADDNVTVVDDVFYTETKEGKTRIENLQDYKVDKEGVIRKKVLYVEPYEVFDQVKKGGKVTYKTNILYKIASIETFMEGMKDLPEKPGKSIKDSAYDLRASIIQKMYGNHTVIHINPKGRNLDLAAQLRSSLGRIMSNYYVDLDVKDYLQAQLDVVDSTIAVLSKDQEKDDKIKILKEKQEAALIRLEQEHKKFLDNLAKKRYASFLDSLNFIASRIPAQTLQSFMAMKLVGWTSNSKNMAYVSHFQTYLLGSDYDIDKAYIMGQSYNDSAVYVGWSTLFDYSSYETLLASKTLPTPRGYQGEDIEVDTESVDSNIVDFFDISPDGTLNSVLSELKAKAIRTIANIIQNYNVDRKLKYANSTPENMEKLENLKRLIIAHQSTKLHTSIAEMAYKNVASANIYAVSHDIRNRDLAYTAIAMDIMQDAAANSPKGNLAGELNMFNPFTKYLMQYQNLVGKNVISIAANGEKIWFNLYYYWTKTLKYGSPEDIRKLMFQQSFSRIQGRAKGNIETKTVGSLPDLDTRDIRIKQALINNFGYSDEEVDNMEYAYVDLLISQLLSAATDNAKELILAKINAGTNFARMYVYVIMMGYSLDDIVAFMTSPAAEFIDSLANPNMFIALLINQKATSAIELAKGIVKPGYFLHGTITKKGGDGEDHEININTYVKNLLVDKFSDKIEFGEKDKLVDVMQKIIKYRLDGFAIDLLSLTNGENRSIYNYLSYCNDLAEKLNLAKLKYPEENVSQRLNSFNQDVAEFDKLFKLSSEASTIASAWLGLNQGIPTSELDILKRLRSMSSIVSAREAALLIKDDIDEDTIIENIQNNNPLLTAEEITEKLQKARERGLVNNFDIIKYLKNSPVSLEDSTPYREAVSDYYDIIKGSINVFDMMNVIPHYTQILECLKAVVVAKNLSIKSRFINKVLQNLQVVTDLQIKGVIRYAEKLMSKKFLEGLNIINLNNADDHSFRKEVLGFNPDFSETKTAEFDLSTLEGITGFRVWVENDFFETLKDRYSENPLVKHLRIISDYDSLILATDTDLRKPDKNLLNLVNFDDIVKGMANFQKIKFDDNFTIADIFQIYNLIVNNNAVGEERLTTAFKACGDENNILHQYERFLGDSDYDIEEELELDSIDFAINMAPKVSEYRSQFSQEDYIKVDDPVRGYVIKYRNNSGNYSLYEMVPEKLSLDEDDAAKQKRIKNFATRCPYEFVHYQKLKVESAVMTTSTEGLSETEVNTLRDLILLILLNNISGGKILIFKLC